MQHAHPPWSLLSFWSHLRNSVRPSLDCANRACLVRRGELTPEAQRDFSDLCDELVCRRWAALSIEWEILGTHAHVVPVCDRSGEDLVVPLFHDAHRRDRVSRKCVPAALVFVDRRWRPRPARPAEEEAREARRSSQPSDRRGYGGSRHLLLHTASPPR